MTVYVIEVGEYSDKYVYGVVTNKNLADKMQHYLEVNTGDNVNIETFDTDVYNTGDYNLKKTYYAVVLSSHGSVISVEEKYDEFPIVSFREAHDGDMRFCVRADTEEKAIKIASERRAMYLARKYGIG